MLKDEIRYSIELANANSLESVAKTLEKCDNFIEWAMENFIVGDCGHCVNQDECEYYGEYMQYGCNDWEWDGDF